MRDSGSSVIQVVEITALALTATAIDTQQKAAAARARAEASRRMAALEFSPRTRGYFAAEAEAWERIAAGLAADGLVEQ